MVRINKKAGPLGFFLVISLTGGNSQAAGFALIDNSASGMGNAFAGGSAIADDPSTVYFNPAGLFRLKDPQLTTALHYVSPKADFSNRGSTAATGGLLNGPDSEGGRDAMVPNLYFVTPLAKNLTFGLGITTPFGLTTEYDDDWVGRYHAVKSSLITVNVNPSLAWRAREDIALGFGLNLQYVDVNLTSAVDLGAVCIAQELGGTIPSGTCASIGALPQQSDGFADLKADNLSWGYNFGVLYEINRESRLGFAYRSKVDHDVEGNANFTVPGELAFLTGANVFVDTNLSASVSLPETVSVSYYHEFSPKLAMMADWTWTRWSRFEELRISYDSSQPDSVTTEAWKDSNRYAIGANYKLNQQWLLRGGLAYDETPVPNAEHRTPRIPDHSRTWLSLGFGYGVSKDLSVDIGYAHLFVSDTKINHQFESGIPTLEHTIKGRYEASVDIFSAQLNWKF